LSQWEWCHKDQKLIDDFPTSGCFYQSMVSRYYSKSLNS
jgi:hypothetical protein